MGWLLLYIIVSFVTFMFYQCEGAGNYNATQHLFFGQEVYFFKIETVGDILLALLMLGGGLLFFALYLITFAIFYPIFKILSIRVRK